MNGAPAQRANPPRSIPFRVFLASPGDVPYERKLAREVIEKVRGERLFRGRVNIEVVAWDQPGAGVPMEAALTPQDAIAEGLPKPEDCDLVVVVLWSRIGTPLPDSHRKADGSTYLSGTEWELENAIQGFCNRRKPSVWLYRREEEPTVGLKDPSRAEKLQSFLSAWTHDDGSLAGGINGYGRRTSILCRTTSKLSGRAPWGPS